VRVFVVEGGAKFVSKEVQRVYHWSVKLEHSGASEDLSLAVVAAIIVHLGQSVGIFELCLVTLARKDGYIINVQKTYEVEGSICELVRELTIVENILKLGQVICICMTETVGDTETNRDRHKERQIETERDRHKERQIERREREDKQKEKNSERGETEERDRRGSAEGGERILFWGCAKFLNPSL
jgi:hypothetical protein